MTEVVYKLAAEKTGFPQDQLKPEFKLLDDLNLDSIKAGSFMAALAKKYQIQGKFDPASFANASLQHIVETVESFVSSTTASKTSETAQLDDSLKTNQPLRAPSSNLEQQPTDEEELNRVKSYSVMLLEEALIASSPVQTREKNILILHLERDSELAVKLSDSLAGKVNKYRSLRLNELNSKSLDSFTDLFVVMPQNYGESDWIQEVVNLLSSTAQMTAFKDLSLSFIQRSNQFARGISNFDKPNSILSAISFAASLHLERPEAKI